MDKNLHQFDQQFHDAFGSYEAPHSPAEMHGDWSQVSAQIPHAPVPHAPVKAPVWGAGKILSFAGAAAVVTTAAVIVYNTLGHKSTTSENAGHQPAIEQPMASANEQAANEN